MSSRERKLAIVLIIAMVLVVGGFLGWQLVLKPLSQKGDEIAKLQDEVGTLEEKKRAIEDDQLIFETKTRKRSLPLETTVAQREYERLIDRMLRQAKFTSPVITPRMPDSKTDVPLLSGKKPAYTKLDFELQVKGDLLGLVDFLYNFYRQPLLQQVRKITVNKPTRSRENSSNRELDITMTIEALVLDRADDRRTLLAANAATVLLAGGAGAVAFTMANVESGQGTPFTAGGILARADDSYTQTSALKEYRRIAEKNIFFDPPPKIEPKVVVEKKEEAPVVREKLPDLAPYLYLTRISHSDGRATAVVFDRMRKEDYEIESFGPGKVKVTRYYYQRVDEANGLVSEVRRKLDESPFLMFGNRDGGNLRQYVVRRVLESELVLEPVDEESSKMLKGAAALVLGSTGASIVPPKQLGVWRVGHPLNSDDPKRAMRNVNYNWEKRELLTRPLLIDDDGDEAINLNINRDGAMKSPTPSPKRN